MSAIEPQPNLDPTTLTGRRVSASLAAIAAAVCWWAWFGVHWNVFLTLGPWGSGALLIYAIVATAAVAMTRTRNMARWFQRCVDSPSSVARGMTAVAIAIVSGAYLASTAINQHRPLQATVHDEFSYLIGMQMLARGRLWMPAHPLAGFFDSFQLIVDPVYASAYFPGTAMFFAVARLSHIPSWFAAIGASGAIVALLYLVVTETIGGAAGLLACLLLLATGSFRTLSTMVMSQIPVMLAGLLVTLAWLNWRRKRRSIWALAIGAAGGWAAIIRPLDAICFCVPVGVAIFAAEPKRAVKAFAWILVGAAPFLAIQVIANAGITGHLFQTPFRLYTDRDHPLTSFGFHRFTPGAKPVSDLPQKQDLYFHEYVPQIVEHTPANVPALWWRQRLREALTFRSPFPYPMLLPLMFIGLAGARSRARAILAVLPMFIALYACYVFFFVHYAVIVAPAVIFGILLGMREVTQLIPKVGSLAGIWLSLMVLGVSIASLPQWDQSADDRMFDAPLLRQANEAVASIQRRPAVVLFRYDPHRNVHEEPVYNADVAWPDDAPIIRAHDRGQHNADIFRYYAERQPDRAFYRFDEASGTLTYLGTASELAAVSPSAQPRI